jgi:hypothetical protein
MDAKNLINAIVEDVDLDIDDLAADFVETIIGRFYFTQTWPERRAGYVDKLRNWLTVQGKLDKLDAVTKLIDTWAAEDGNWNDRYAEDYGDGEKPKWQKTRPKKKNASARRPSKT